MSPRSILFILALAATMVNAAPSPVVPEKVAGSLTGPELSKRTDHSGIGTEYNQGGAFGSCGQQNPDSAFVAALSNYWMKNQVPGPYCGRKIQVTNTGSSDGVGGEGNTIIATVEDTCPGCDENHVDLSLGAWNKLTNNHDVHANVDITWHFCNANGQC